MRYDQGLRTDGPPITDVGFRMLRAELDRLEHVERPALAELVRTVRQDGELTDNPVLLDVMDDFVQLDRRISQLREQLASAVVVTAVSGERVGVGHRVVMEELDTADRLEFELVGPYESDAEHGRVSIDSPVGSATIGREAGDEVHVHAPLGPRTMRIVSVRAPRAAPPITG